MSERKKYPAFNGLGRVAMIWGVPLMVALAIFAPLILITVGLTFVVGPGALLFAALGVPIFLFVKNVCETDDQALHILWLELQCAVRRRYAHLYGKSFTIAPIKYGRRLSVYRAAMKEQYEKRTSHE